jgi:glycosyltransferase involved in cell wall biosynthesis
MQNTYKPKFTYVIPFRYSQDRIMSLKRVVDWLSGYQGVEVIVVEQDKHSKIDHLNLKVRHIFCESDAPFNKAWAYNVALRRTNSNILVFGDADFVMNPNELIEGLKALEFCECVFPTSTVVKLNGGESNMDLGSIFNIKRTEPKQNMSDGVSLYKREAIMKIGGWNEDILGLGYSNKFQDLKVKRMLNYKTLDFTGYHMNHMSMQQDPALNQRNQQILDYYVQPTSDLNQHIVSTVPRSGYINKYQG